MSCRGKMLRQSRGAQEKRDFACGNDVTAWAWLCEGTVSPQDCVSPARGQSPRRSPPNSGGSSDTNQACGWDERTRSQTLPVCHAGAKPVHQAAQPCRPRVVSCWEGQRGDLLALLSCCRSCRCAWLTTALLAGGAFFCFSLVLPRKRGEPGQ